MTTVDSTTIRGQQEKNLSVGRDAQGRAVSLNVPNACPDGRRDFAADEALALLARLELAEGFGAWWEDTDKNGKPFAILIRDGRFYGDETIREDPETCRVNVTFAAVQKAINARAKWS